MTAPGGSGARRDPVRRPTSRSWVAIYDGNCRVCTRSAALLERWDRRRQIEVIPAQAPGVRERFPWIPAEAYDRALQLVGPGNATHEGAAAIEQLLDLLPRGWMLGWVFRLPFVGALLDRFYRWFARHRHRFGCGEHCAYRPR